MPADIIDGEAIAQTIHTDTAARIERLRGRGHRPGLAVILVGDDPASLTYIRAKRRACADVGIRCEVIRLSGGVSASTLLGLIADLNAEPCFHGLLVQLPLPEHLDPLTVVRAVQPEKDVDGQHPLNLGLLLQGAPDLVPCTPAAVQQLLLRSGHDPAGKHVVVLGRSNLVGKPLAALLMQRSATANATVTVCHRQTPRLESITKQADILVVATGSPAFVTRRLVRPGAVIIDVGVSRVADSSRRRGYRLVGDVDFDDVREYASAISPVPGGVGPMTVAMLLANTVAAAERAAEHRGGLPGGRAERQRQAAPAFGCVETVESRRVSLVNDEAEP
jgi:methylenetetrahydrofolate dehydrogenase (NADP+)/methenyltetrahydrofolate cyclohydrolase